jgi:FkbM family methyltransferase
LISYAQNGEDAVLARLFRDATGFYIDIGAGHPVADSVTKYFSDRGWRGMNIEPLPEEHALLCEDRRRDINVRAAITDRNGRVTLYPGPPSNRGASTLLAELAPSAGEREAVPSPIEVDSRRLMDLLDEHEVRSIDFLKIDVEGYEAVVIGDVDWALVRPRVIVVEATLPNTPTPSHEEWEPILLEAGYRCALFDGLNRFYALASDTEALETLAAPANVFDDAQPWSWVVRVDEAEARAEAADAQTRALFTARDEAVQHATEVAAAAAAHMQALTAARDEAVQREREVAVTADAEMQALTAARDEAVEYAATLEAGRADSGRWAETVHREIAELAATASDFLRRVDPNAADLSSR